MKLLGIILFCVLSLFCVTVFAQKHKSKENKFAENKQVRTKPIKTSKTWTEESTKTKYPIYISSTGLCFIIKTSKCTGREYRVYIGDEISKEICEEEGITYAPRNKSK